jgi:U3 small nucleolar RNA-associated protein 15
MQVLLYNGRTQQLERQVTRFKDIAYSGCYRVDGRLLTAGGENGIVQVHYDRHDDVGLVLYLGRHWVLCCHVHSHIALVLVREHCVDAQVFDVGSRAVLRQLKGHQRPVHVARFSPDKLHVLSGGDDATV